MPIIWLFGDTLHKLGITIFLEILMMVAHVYTIAKLILHPMVSKQASKHGGKEYQNLDLRGNVPSVVGFTHHKAWNKMLLWT